jgi:serine/threonine-protein kinase
VRRHDARVGSGRVISETPAGGTKADKASVVTLNVSSGPATKLVPGVEGKGRHEATGILRRAGFKVKERDESSTSTPKDHVISATPAPGRSAEVGSTVTLVVSTGPPQVSVPKVVGSTLESARATLGGLGLTVTSTEKASDQAPGTVLSQSVPASSRVAKGTTVALVVAKANEVKVPNVVGRSESDAVNAISAAGLSPQTTTKEVGSPDLDGVVIAEKPAGGRLKKGGTVALTIGHFAPNLNPDPGTGTGTTGATTPTTPSTTQGSGGTGSG